MTGRSIFALMLALAASSLATPPASAADGDPAAGKALFERTCENCHAVVIGVNKVGPSLWNVLDRKPAAVPDFAYSEAMKANKQPWTVAALDAYLADPRGDVHGVKMFFKGLPNPADRANVIAYLERLK
ncbi:c-type cytochrome [Bradyrhizobium sp. INPA01-394B]|uniref:C-type cytochrome n=2 Tax=Bradyrhizobium campsiandrae TaxID=1729892 RepID=A0ABR7U6W5_9BRAD|nr:c-type cytochrome [Bradyrhizobium campsiandrae]MBC9876974.1 c-type cytochrome [Bradyrhizobium campsiandrae]MBC9979763.1 c-type cytochrome [Bradyrhizobium campsiandrae]